jgi:hypothetical protein
MKIVFYAGYQKIYLNPNKIESTGVGGTEQCIIHLASEMAKEHDVYVTGCVENLDYCNVKYRDQDALKSELKSEYVDCVIACSYINYLLELDFLNFDNSIFWVHNTDFYPWHRGEELANGGVDLLSNTKMKHIVCLTEWHKKIFIEQFPSAKNKVIVIGNGISNNLLYTQLEKKNPHSFIYTSHSERGLDLILNDWLNIKKKIPQAVLNIATPEYGLDFFNKHFKQKVLSLPNVIFRGSLSIKDLYKLMSVSTYWYYPTSYEETFCITALEMLGHKVTPITTKTCGLKETLNGFNISDLDKINSEKIEWSEVSKYIKKCDWSFKKTQWMKYIYDMNSKQKNTNTIAELDVEPVVINESHDVEEGEIIFDDEVNNTQSDNNLNENILQIDCVYVILEDASTSNLEKYKSEIRSKLKWFNGPIVGKKLLDNSKINDDWFSVNGYEFFKWKSKNSNNKWYNRDLTYEDMSLAISHHQIWVNAKNSNYRNIIVLEEGFKIEDEQTAETLVKVPHNYDLFYLGRDKLYADKAEVVIADNINLPSASYGTYGYMLSAKGVESLLQQNFNSYIMPIGDFLISCYTKHDRSDLNFIVNDLIAYAPSKKIVSNSKELIGPQVERTSGRKYPELYDYWDNPEEWKKRFVAYATRTKEWELIIDEPFDNCFSMPLFTQEFCEKIREEAEHADAWTTDRHEHYPTTDMLLDVLDLTEIYYDVLKEFVMPASIYLYNLTSSGWDCMNTENFLAKYVPDAQGHLSLHHDASDVTALVTLSNFDEYEGGGTYFSHQKKLVKEKQGYVSIHPGNITHRHGARATTKGKRYIIVSFMTQNSTPK